MSDPAGRPVQLDHVPDHFSMALHKLGKSMGMPFVIVIIRTTLG
ncbi:hypothetical protein [Massilia pseudoviolaceinigra]|nr:hypothetical protein [Massilia sp. CCM 9206]